MSEKSANMPCITMPLGNFILGYLYDSFQVMLASKMMPGKLTTQHI